MASLSILRSIILGLVQGGTEFIPVSSSAHLVLVPWLLGWSTPSLPFDTTVHLGTLVAVVAYYRKDVVALIRGWIDSMARRRLDTLEARLAWLLVLGTMPAAVMGVMWGDFFEGLFSSPAKVAWLLLVTGLILVIGDSLGARRRGLDTLSPLDVLIIGLAQGLAIAPGISRSGITISAGLLLGLRREVAARYSFLLSIPIILGAGLSQILKFGGSGGLATQWGYLAAGFVAASIGACVSIWLLLSYVRRHGMHVFAAYCWALGALSLVIAYLTGNG